MLGLARISFRSACGFAAVLLISSVALAQDPMDDEIASEADRDAAFAALSKEIALLEKQSALLKHVARLAGPSVVHIDTERRDATMPRAYQRGQIEEAGSGFIIKMADRYFVVTNRHVVKSAQLGDIKISLADGRQIKPAGVWSDPETDVAVLSVDSPRLMASRVGNSDIMEIGDFVLAVGSPFGLNHSVTFGIISAKGRRDLELGSDVRFQDFLQTDAAINPGNSGGPLLNMRGEVIGMNTAIASSSGGSEGIGFAIPMNMVMIVVEQLVERGSVERAYLGVALDSKYGPALAVSLGLSRSRGARVTRITPDSPAEKARLREGDVILRFNGVRIDNDSHLISLVSLTEVDSEVPLQIYRERQLIEVLVKLEKAPAKAAK